MSFNNNDDGWEKVSYIKKKRIKKHNHNHNDCFDNYDCNINKKRILCKNILKSGICPYNSKCRYAHSYDEQILSPIRQQSYDIIMGKIDDLSNINLEKETELYQDLLLLCNICENCVKNNCSGGYNCDFGCFKKKYQICEMDLKRGCSDSNCKKIKLTERGLVPYEKRKKIRKRLPELIRLNDDYFKTRYNRKISKKKRHEKKKDGDIQSIESDMSNDESSNEMLIKFCTINIKNDIDMLNKSIFEVPLNSILYM
jgi:hypothetical protein